MNKKQIEEMLKDLLINIDYDLYKEVFHLEKDEDLIDRLVRIVDAHVNKEDFDRMTGPILPFY